MNACGRFRRSAISVQIFPRREMLELLKEIAPERSDLHATPQGQCWGPLMKCPQCRYGNEEGARSCGLFE